MARLEFVSYHALQAHLDDEAKLAWKLFAHKNIDSFPQIFWDDGSSWTAANLWALERSSDHRVDAETVKRTMKHLRTYAAFLEECATDWRHFPVKKDEQPLRKFRKHLIDRAEAGSLGMSTAQNCMAAVIQFYRYADANNLVGISAPLWKDRLVVIPFFDSAGFKRTLTRLSSELSIPNRRRIGTVLEDGLLPLRSDHMADLLKYTSENEVEELHLMLATGFFTGARIGTITTLTISALEATRADPHTPRVRLLSVGPGTGITTKFSVSGEIMIPDAVFADLKRYASSAWRLLREAKAAPADKNKLFLTRKGTPYTVETVNRLVYEMRKRAVAAGLKHLSSFRFHQTRATFGTWLMQLLLQAGNKTNAIQVVRDAMLHKDERTTLGYITFLERTRGKALFAAQFNLAFTGLTQRNWNELNT